MTSISSALARALFAWALAFGAPAAAFAQAPAEAPTASSGPSHNSIHRLGPDARQLRFEGESSSRVWPVYVTAAQAQTRARVHVAYTNAISVMPEASRLSISVNDVAVAQASIAASSDPGVIDVELPRGLLESGYNAVTVSVDQRHRVDCSIDATYELWTQLDPATSGLTFPGLADDSIAQLDDLASLSPDATGAVPIHAVLAKDAAPEVVDLTMRAIEAIAIRGGFARPVVDVSPEIDEKNALSVVVGAGEDLRRRGFGQYTTEASGVLLKDGEDRGHTVVVVTGQDSAEIETAIQQILPPRRATAAGANASATRALVGVGGFRVTGDTRVSFHDLGVQTQEFTGRLFRTSFDIVMPPDFYSADYDKLTLLIDAGYSAHLDPRSQILVRVNDRDAASLQLRNPDGDLFRQRPVTVPLGAMRPGYNHVVIEAQLPSLADKACDVHALLDGGKRFVLLDQSELIVPSIARIARLPNLSITAASGFPYAGGEPSHLFLPHVDAETIGAAATFLARAAVAARRPLHLALTTNRGDLANGSALMIGAVSDFSSGLFDQFGLDYASIRENWAHQDSGAVVAAAQAERQISPTGPPNGDVFDQWSDSVHTTRWSLDPSQYLRAWYDRYINVHAIDFALFRAADEKFAPDGKATIILAQARAPNDGRNTWTIVTAPSNGALARDMRSLAAPTAWNQIEGRAAALDPRTNGVVVTKGRGGYFIETAALTPANVRLVAAGWLSSNVDEYALILGATALLLGLCTAVTVRVYGART
jgi:hypothetical protein